MTPRRAGQRGALPYGARGARPSTPERRARASRAAAAASAREDAAPVLFVAHGALEGPSPHNNGTPNGAAPSMPHLSAGFGVGPASGQAAALPLFSRR